MMMRIYGLYVVTWEYHETFQSYERLGRKRQGVMKAMAENGFSKFHWGFLFIMLDFRLQGIDIMPDVIGFVLFMTGFQTLAVQSEYFQKGKAFNVIMIVISIFSIYEKPVQGGGIHINPIGAMIGLISLVLTIIVVYHLFMGIKEMASKQGRLDLVEEAGQKWTYFLVFQLVALPLFLLVFIPPLFIVGVFAMFFAAIVLMVILMRFMKTCGVQLR
jgi:hypothetical protein